MLASCEPVIRLRRQICMQALHPEHSSACDGQSTEAHCVWMALMTHDLGLMQPRVLPTRLHRRALRLAVRRESRSCACRATVSFKELKLCYSSILKSKNKDCEIKVRHHEDRRQNERVH